MTLNKTIKASKLKTNPNRNEIVPSGKIKSKIDKICPIWLKLFAKSAGKTTSGKSKSGATSKFAKK